MRYQPLLALAVMTWLPLSSATADQALSPDELISCPYTQEEIEAALGLKVSPGEAADMELPDGRDVGCFYQAVEGSTTLAVRQTWGSGGVSGTVQTGAREEPIAGDPDGARWTIGGGDKDEPRVELSYTRGQVQTRVLIHGRIFREAEIQPKLLNLKRVP